MAKAVEFYHYTSCSTCKDARTFLRGKGARLQERDFFRERFTEAELRRLLDGQTIREAFSWRSPQVKALGLKDKTLSDEEMIGWMLKEPRLIKRPVIVVDRKAYFGFQAKELKRLL